MLEFVRPKPKSIAIISVFTFEFFAQKLHSLWNSLKRNPSMMLYMVLSSVCFVSAHFPYGHFPKHRQNIMPLIIHMYISTFNKYVSCFILFAETNSNRITHLKCWIWIWTEIFQFYYSSSRSDTFNKHFDSFKSQCFHSCRPAWTENKSIYAVWIVSLKP